MSEYSPQEQAAYDFGFKIGKSLGATGVEFNAISKKKWTDAYRHQIDELIKENEQLNDQLAAEREKLDSVLATHDCIVIVKDLEQQLAIAQKNADCSANAAMTLAHENQQLRDQLASERERADTWWQAKVNEVRRQLAEAEQQLAAEQEKVQTLVDALKEIERDSNGWEKSIAQAALAKVKEGK